MIKRFKVLFLIKTLNRRPIDYWRSVSKLFFLSLVIDKVFRGDCATRQVYEEGAKEVALSVVGGINCEYILSRWLFSCTHCPL